MVGQLIDWSEEIEDLAVVLQESDHRLVQSRQFLVRLIASRVVRASAVEDIASAVARLVLGDAVAVGEAIYTDHQRALAVVFREGGGTIQRVGLEDVVRCGAEAIGPVLRRFLDARKLWQFHQALQDRHQVRIGEGATVEGEQVAQVLDSPRYGVDEVALVLEVPPETIRSQHLQRAEEHEERQPVGKVARGRHLGVLLETLVVFEDQFAAQFEGILRARLP